MQTLILKLAIGAAIVATAPAADAASDFLLELDGIKGESKASASIGSFEWTAATATGIFNPFTPAYAGGLNVASGDLNGDGRWESLTLTARTLDGTSFFRYEMKDVLISSYSLSGHGETAPDGHKGHKDWIIIESMSAPTMRWSPPDATGGRGEWIVGNWDTDTGRFLGDNKVFGAFDDLGAERLADGTLAITAAVPEPGTWALMLLGAAGLGVRLRRQRQAVA